MIRFIDQKDGQLTYRSGCGITALSDCTSEYKEMICLLYTSDAADERSSVDLGGRRIIKKKKEERQDGGGNTI